TTVLPPPQPPLHRNTTTAETSPLPPFFVVVVSFEYKRGVRLGLLQIGGVHLAAAAVGGGCRGSSPLGGCLFEAAEAAGACLLVLPTAAYNKGVFVSWFGCRAA
nr:hypothetical protein [Tanacetum cinerariifolium]